MSRRRWMFLIGFALAVPARAQSGLDEISARLESRLQALPDRWDKIPPPLVPVSGRSSEAVLAAASAEEKALVSKWITSLALSPPAERASRIERELHARPLSEVDLWLPERLTDELRTTSLEEPTLFVEAWLEWAEALGRKDALLVAASLGLERSARRAESERLLEIASRWAGLPSPDDATRGRAAVLAQYAARLFAAGENQKALDAYGTARKLFERAGDRRGQGDTFLGEADVLAVSGNSGKAIEDYRRARELFAAAGDRRGEGNALLGEARVRLVQGDKPRALDACKRARQLFDAGDRRGQGNTFKVEADVLFRSGENEKAVDAYQRARKLFAEAGDRRGQGDTFNGEADVLSQSGDNEKALATYKQALELYEAAGHRLGQGMAFSGEANALYFLHDYDQSLAAFNRARDLFDRIGYRWGQGSMLVDEAYVDVLLEEPEQALDAYRRARELFVEVGSRPEEGDTWVGEGEILAQLGEDRKALDAYDQAHRLYAQLGDRRGEATTLRDEADVLAQRGETAKALAAYRRARQLSEQIELPLGVGNALLGEARLQSRQGGERAAKDLAAQAVAAYRKAGSVDDERSAWLVVAAAEHALGNPEPAVAAAREAVRLHTAWRSKRISAWERADGDESIAPAYDILVPVLLASGRTEQALAAAEEARSHALLDLLAAGFKRGEPGAAVELRAERQRLVSELAQIETESRQAAEEARRTELQRERHRIDLDLNWNQYQTLAAEQGGLLTAQALDAAGIRAVARETGPILLYYAAEKELIGFLVPADGTEVFAARIELSRDRLTEAVQRYLHDEANPVYAESAARRSRELWDRLLAPFAARLSASGPAGGPLVIVPHGPLHELPFETLLDPTGTPAFERWAVSIAPSVSTLARTRERHREPRPQDSFLAFSSGRGLELTEAEAGEVATLFGDNKAAFKATEARFENYEHLVPGVRQLLISTTGTWAPGDPWKTYLEILPTRDVHDSRLNEAEIATLPLSAELVVLAACDTARGETRPTDERMDLTRAFLIAGAASVLATRWKVPEDQATSRFLLDFYRAYRQGGPGGTAGKGLRKDQALNRARRRSRERGDPPQVWAAWVLVGDAR